MICCVNLKLQQYCRGAVLHIMLPKVDLILVSSLFCVKKWRKRTFCCPGQSILSYNVQSIVCHTRFAAGKPEIDDSYCIFGKKTFVNRITIEILT